MRPFAHVDPTRRVMWALGATTAALCATSAVIAIVGAPAHPGLVAAARALMVGVPMAVGLYAWRRRPQERFGPVLVAAGVIWFVTTLAESGDALPYSIGRAAGWIAEVLLVYLVLSFPTGRLPGRADAWLVAAGATVVATLYLPSLLVTAGFPVPSPYTSCRSDCPANAFFVLDAQPGFVDAAMLPLREFLAVALFAAATVRVAQRLGTATRLMRLVLIPVLGVAIVRLSLLALTMVVRRVAPESSLVLAAMWLVAFAVPAIAIGFLIGLLRQRLSAGEAVQRLALREHGHPDASSLRNAFAEAFGDPSLELAFPVDGGDVRWAGGAGEPVPQPLAGSGRCVTEVRGDDGLVAVIVHDDALRDQRDALIAAGAHLATALENARLTAQLRSSRARAAAAAAQERERIERDLHDSAQQRLVALQMQLARVAETLPDEPTRARLDELGQQVELALDEIRSIARGVYPPLLAERGLAEALRAAAGRMPLATHVTPRAVGRYRPDVESAVYFTVLEALQNAAKHAAGATRVTVSLSAGRELRFTVRDDGAGFEADGRLDGGGGLTTMRDRMAAIGGTVRVVSVRGTGTVVSGIVPLGVHQTLERAVSQPAVSLRS